MTWVQAPNDVRHNLIYGLMPGYSLSERPTSETEKHWTLSSLIEHTDFLVHPLISSTFVDKRGNLTPDGRYIRRSITRTRYLQFSRAALSKIDFAHLVPRLLKK